MKGAGKTKMGLRKAASAAQFDCATAFQKIALDCVGKVRLHHSSACAGDAEAVHQIRVAITRLRSAVFFFASIVVDAEWRRLKKELAWLNGSLGAARDSDVVVEYARRKRYRDWAQRMIGEDLDAHQTRDHRRMVRCLRSPRFHDLIEAMSGWIGGGSWLPRWERMLRRKSARPLKAYCKRELNRWRRRLIRKGRRLKTLGASDRHRLRIRAKRFRYMLEALTGIVPVFGDGEFRHVHKPAKQLQRTLGDLRDLKRFARPGLSAQGDNPGQHRPPGYRRQRQKLRSAAISAYRGLKEAGAC
ncbi:CHAD domain-containing protein [Bradyrhizobium sp. AUGA SZCCT0431]|uniref:CHAD domain-containing protein n=1 Tax=Bradyrhizobium sp. AUGA SZCCT0431 TaxID=2807674 RepID=UPI001BADDC6F|nr:CHAD domain-containing protein [Bradyrhizobium sp. AUGA SZCCT0431]MBR1148174.1 CHAD domain-containing protein [Bradyrhizobium sp. AUGA SZCCT0431]